MAQPQKYKRTKNFQENAGDSTDHGAINSELDAVAASLDGVVSNLSLIQKDDGTIATGSVGTDALTDEARQSLKGARGEAGAQGPRGEKGEKGEKGDPGERGPVGASFVADIKDLSDFRGGYDGLPKGTSFLAIDTGLLYWKLGNAPGEWSSGVPFGKGEKGEKGGKGEKGENGEPGPIGLTGAQGPQGVPGVAGPAGKNGAVLAVDTSVKSVSIVGRKKVFAQLSLSSGTLTITLRAE